jgi:hypothetical protein
MLEHVFSWQGRSSLRAWGNLDIMLANEGLSGGHLGR